MRKLMAILCTSSALLFGCGNSIPSTEQNIQPLAQEKQSNPVVYFEIPVNDLDRAMVFYTSVFGFDFSKEVIDGNDMALFPFNDAHRGISGALAKGEIYKPTLDGVVIYFHTENIDETIQRALLHGGQTLYPKTDNGIGYVAEVKDTEGNRVALYQKKTVETKE